MRMKLMAVSTVAALVLMTSCNGERVGQVVKIDVVDADSSKLVTLPYFWSGIVPDGQQQAWLTPGSLLSLNDEPVFPFQRGDSTTLKLEFTEWCTRLSGQIVSLNLAEDSAMAWLAQASDDELSGVRLVELGDSLRPGMRPVLERLARINPQVGLVSDDQDVMQANISLFTPRSLFTPSLDGLVLAPAQVNRLEQLWFMDADSGEHEGLSGMNHLRHLLITDWDGKAGLPFPETLEALTLVGGEVDMTALHPLVRLHTLALTGSEWSGASDLPGLKQLRWIGLPANATQAELAAIVAAHPKLEVIEILGVDSVTDLSPLRGAPHLKAVTLDGEFVNLSVLQELASLEFVGFSDQMVKNYPDEVAAVRAALPGAAVVEVTGLCLGSGWVLLLIPAVLLMLLARPARRAA